jgi:uncharacterized membrane protein
MLIWILVATVGGILSLMGLITLFRQYRRDRITLRSLLAYVVGYVAFVSYALASALRPDIASGPASVAMLLPAFVAIVVAAHEHRRARDAG